MRNVANRLERLCCINRDIRLAVALAGPSSDQLLALRADFGFECSQLLNQLTAKLMCPEEARLASRILDAFVAMQQVLTSHQHAWSLSDIERAPRIYVVESQKAHAAVINFLEDALHMIEAAVGPQRERLEPRRPFAPRTSLRLTGTG